MMLRLIPDEIQPMLQDFTDLLRSKLPHIVLGLYIQGSVALKGFNKNRSDIDFIVVLKNAEVRDEDILDIEAIHEKLRSKHAYYMVTEGQYTSLEHLNKSIRENNDRFPRFYYGESQGLRSGFVDPTSLWILKHHGISVFGPEVHTLNIAVDWPDVHGAMNYNLNIYWTERREMKSYFWIINGLMTLY